MLPPGITLSTRHFLVGMQGHYVQHDVVNIQQAHFGQVGPEGPLPATGIPTRQAQGFVHVSLTASAWRRRRAASAYGKNDVIRKTGNT